MTGARRGTASSRPARGLVAVGLMVLSAVVMAAPSIERVEPPFWWQGFAHSELQLLVYGEGIAELQPQLAYPGVEVARVTRVANPNYLFVYLQIRPEAEPGRFEIVFANDETRIAHDYELRQKNPDPAHAQGYSTADAIYLITPDRFANGDSANDNIASLGDAVNRDGWQDRHGGDLAGIRKHLDYISDMGFTAIWLNPVLENAMPTTSYHGYATTDFYRVDARFGSNEDYRDLVQAARTRGIGVIMDMIANHSGLKHWWLDDLPTPDWINHKGKFVQTTHERTAIQDPYGSDYDRRAFADGWFVAQMPDLNQRNPLLAEYLIQNTLWWIEYLGLAGIRQDTYPYADKSFMSEWTRRVMTEYPQFNIVGEQWTTNPIVLAYWQRGKVNHDGYVSYLPDLMDFPLQAALVAALNGEERPHESGWMDLYRMLANDVVYASPQNMVVFADNHDMSRIYTQLDEDFDLWKMAMVFILTTRGAPQIYYGTEILMANRDSGDHGLIRSDFPGGWPDDVENAFTGEKLGAEQLRAQRFLRRLLRWRREQDVIHRGDLMHFYPVDGAYVYLRYGRGGTILVALNKSRTTTDLNPARFDEVLEGRRRAFDVIRGEPVEFYKGMSVSPRDVLVLEIESGN